MNGKELQALRKLLMLDASEAAELIGGVTTRSWQYWEAGRTAVPADVAEKMEDLLNQRNDLLSARESELFQAGTTEIQFYSAFSEYQKDFPGATKLGWRLMQGVAASLYADRFVKLI